MIIFLPDNLLLTKAQTLWDTVICTFQYLYREAVWTVTVLWDVKGES